MRVALVLYGDLDFISGGFLYDRMLVEHLRRQGEEVKIVSLPWRSYAGGLLDNLSPGLMRRLTAIRADVILQDELAHPSLLRFQLAASNRGKALPVVAIVHHLRCSEARPAWQNKLYRRAERRYLAAVQGFIFNSRATRKTVEALVGKSRPSVLAYPGADRFASPPTRQPWPPRARQPGPLRLLFLGNVIPRKGLHTLIAALALLSREAWQLTVVGSLEIDLPYVHEIRRQIAGAGLEGQITFTGTLHQEQLAPLPGPEPRPGRALLLRGLRHRLSRGHGLRPAGPGHHRRGCRGNYHLRPGRVSDLSRRPWRPGPSLGDPHARPGPAPGHEPGRPGPLCCPPRLGGRRRRVHPALALYCTKLRKVHN